MYFLERIRIKHEDLKISLQTGLKTVFSYSSRICSKSESQKNYLVDAETSRKGTENEWTVFFVFVVIRQAGAVEGVILDF